MTKVQLGKFDAGGQQYQQLQINRILGPNIGDQVYLGRFNSSDGNHNIALSVHDVISDTITQYRVFSNMNVINGTWTEVLPVSNDRRDIVVSVRTDGPVISVRMTRLMASQGGKEYRTKCLNLRPVLEKYSRETETGIDVIPGPHPHPHPHPQPGPMPPVPPEPEKDITWLSKLVVDHISSPAPHVSHEIIARKNKPNGYAGLDENGIVNSSCLPARGTLTIRIGEQVITFDGSNNVELDLTSAASGRDLGVAVAQNLNVGTAASDTDIAQLFDDDPATPEKNPDDPGYLPGYVDDDTSEGSTEDPGEASGDTPGEASDDDIGNLFG